MSKTESSCGQAYRKTAHPVDRGGWQGWERTEVADTLNAYDNTEGRTPVIVLNDQGGGVMSVSIDKTSTLRANMKHHEPIVFVYDARGNGGGGVTPTITGDHQDRITDYTAIVLERDGREDIRD